MLLNEVAIIEHLARNRLEKVLPDGLRMSHFIVLSHLVRMGDGRSPARIARAVQVERPAMTNTIQRLEARGLVLVAADPVDRRVKRVFLTPAGRRLRDQAVAAAIASVASIARDVGDREVLAALPVLRRLRVALDQARDAEDPVLDT
ncbi:MarR family winged helix-turn-helix transcriptional regulator [Roseomonas rosulenta]|uniref:MarR family winged helix-turn-helix transcriptional regulator n=1 Tax=Roseomonas rosulenta TaxID=2748667 RepID=UPI0018DFFD7C|nr:MarR family transcriptional regulator [Roseomonas rosulenta]